MIGEQATIEDALAVRDERSRLALDTSDPWTLAAEEALEDLRASGAAFTAEDVRARAGTPPHPNALGGLFIGASKRGEIVKVGYRLASRTVAHARPLAVWRDAEAVSP